MLSALERWFGADEPWQRPPPTRGQLRTDVRWAVVALLMMEFANELTRSVGIAYDDALGPLGIQLAMLSLAAAVALRRVFPCSMALFAGIHLTVMSVASPVVATQMPMQLVYFLLTYSAMAWARERRVLMAAIGAVLAILVLYFAWTFAFSSGWAEIQAQLNEEAAEQVGWVSPVAAVVLYTIMTNVLFFAFAIGTGQVSWRGALRQAQVEVQAETIQVQSAQLVDQAVMEERLRIARELHDVVAHHVSVMGVQAAAARRVMDRDPEAARAALSAVEQSSRDGVGQMRDLLGTLRSDSPGAGLTPDSGPGERTDRAPQPTLAALPALVAQASTPSCTVTADLVEDVPGALAQVPPPVQLTAYRIVQEALANIRRHSTARSARVSVRVDAERVEIEVVDDGLPRHGTSGTGLGLQGMRERADLLGGGYEFGPRRGQHGWRVLVWLPVAGHRVEGDVAQDELIEEGAHR